MLPGAGPFALNTERLVLQPFSDAYLTTRYLAWLNDPEVLRFSERRHRPTTMDSARAYLATFADSPHFFWAIVARDPALGHIGNITAHVDRYNAVADVGILIGERGAWGRGYGTEAWAAVCAFLLRQAGLRKVSAGTLACNHGMLAIMRRTGMRDDGRRVRHYLVDGVETDIVHMALFRDEDAPRLDAERQEAAG